MERAWQNPDLVRCHWSIGVMRWQLAAARLLLTVRQLLVASHLFR